MSPDSYASYRAAGALGDERDDDPTPSAPYFPVVDYAAVWYAPVTFRDSYTGEITEDTAEVGRYFSGDRHADPHKAAMRWARLMARRHGHAWLRCYLDGVADVCDVPVKMEPQQ